MNERVYHLKLLRRIDFMGIGLLIASVSICPLSMNIQNMITGQASLTDYLSAVLMLMLLPFGILMMGWASSKVVIRDEGLEYQIPGVVLKAKWTQLQNLGYHNQGYSGRSLIVNPTDGEVTLKSWAKPIKGILKHKPSDTFISVAWFKDSDGNSLEADIAQYLPSRSPEPE
jgi:hypothetical protein